MPIFLSIGQIDRELELPPLNMNAKQFSLYGTTLNIKMKTCKGLKKSHHKTLLAKNVTQSQLEQ